METKIVPKSLKHISLNEQVYSVKDLEQMFANINELKSDTSSQDDIVDVINKILSIFKGGIQL